MPGRFVPNPNLERELQQLIEQEVQPQVNAAVQDVVRGVRDEMVGDPADQVYTELVARLQQEFPAIELNEPELREIAQTIEDGTLEG